MRESSDHGDSNPQLNLALSYRKGYVSERTSTLISLPDTAVPYGLVLVLTLPASMQDLIGACIHGQSLYLEDWRRRM